MDQKESNPIKKENILCPYCRVSDTKQSIRTNWFIVEKRDRDTHPFQYKWLNEHYKYINPLHYAIWTCDSCGFTDYIEKYVKYSYNISLDYPLKNTFSTIIIQKPEFIEKVMEKYLNTSDLHTKSIYQLFILIYLTEEQDHTLQIKEELARIYLRLAWLYREIKTNNNDIVYEEKSSMKDSFIEEFDAFSSHFNLFRQHFALFKENLRIKFIKKLDVSDVELHILNNFFDQYIEGAEKIMINFEQENKSLYDNILENGLTTNENIDDVGIDLTFMQETKKIWPGIMMSEMNALLKSNSYFLDLINNGFYDEILKKKLKVFEIVAINFYRVNYFSKTTNFLDKITKILSELFKQKNMQLEQYNRSYKDVCIKINQMKTEAKKSSALLDEKKKLEVKIQIRRNELKQIKEYATLFQRMKEKAHHNDHELQIRKAREVLDKSQGINSEGKVNLLREKGFSEKLIEEIVHQ
jgi:uncharacterized protein (DUF2225 family)